eukprot:11370879-Alexandrium_andersonii.AAC.2
MHGAMRLHVGSLQNARRGNSAPRSPRSPRSAQGGRVRPRGASKSSEQQTCRRSVLSVTMHSM